MGRIKEQNETKENVLMMIMMIQLSVSELLQDIRRLKKEGEKDNR